MASLRRLAFGPRELLHVASLVMRVRVWAELVHDLPGDQEACRELRRLAGALVHHADQRDWPALGAAAGAVVRYLSGPLDARAGGLLRVLALRVERVVDQPVPRLERDPG